VHTSPLQSRGQPWPVSGRNPVPLGSGRA
jgi:hypothetical protein